MTIGATTGGLADVHAKPAVLPTAPCRAPALLAARALGWVLAWIAYSLGPLVPSQASLAQTASAQSDWLGTIVERDGSRKASNDGGKSGAAPAPFSAGTTTITREPQGGAGAGPAAGGIPLRLSALLTEGGQAIADGLVWYVFAAERERNGKYRHLRTERRPAPTLRLAPGAYFITVTYGRAFLTRRIEVAADKPRDFVFVLNAGGLRVRAIWPDGRPLPDKTVRYDIYSDERDQLGNRQKILGDAPAGVVVRLNAGIYHIVSTYGDANATVEADVTVEAGRITEAIINHRAARVTFKLVEQPGGEALADTHWKILRPNGTLVTESIGAIPTHVLAAGRYRVLALRHGRQFAREFSLAPGAITQVEVLSR